MCTLLLSAADLLDLGQGGVQVEGSQAVAQIEHVHRFISFEIVDREGEFTLYKSTNKRKALK